jgi:hypothetical protein
LYHKGIIHTSNTTKWTYKVHESWIFIKQTALRDKKRERGIDDAFTRFLSSPAMIGGLVSITPQQTPGICANIQHLLPRLGDAPFPESNRMELDVLGGTGSQKVLTNSYQKPFHSARSLANFWLISSLGTFYLMVSGLGWYALTCATGPASNTSHHLPNIT